MGKNKPLPALCPLFNEISAEPWPNSPVAHWSELGHRPHLDAREAGKCSLWWHRFKSGFHWKEEEGCRCLCNTVHLPQPSHSLAEPSPLPLVGTRKSQISCSDLQALHHRASTAMPHLSLGLPFPCPRACFSSPGESPVVATPCYLQCPDLALAAGQGQGTQQEGNGGAFWGSARSRGYW